MRKRWWKAALIVATGAVVMTGCDGYTNSGNPIDVVTVDLPGGGSVVCVSISKSVDCDWGGVDR